MLGIEITTISSFNIIVFTLAFIALILGSISDIKKREVADILNYGLFFSAIVLRLLYSLIILNPLILIEGLVGFLIGTTIGMVMFYTNQWGGGDAKMLIALSTLIGINILPLSINVLTKSFLLSMIVNIFILGSFMGLIWSIYMAIKNKDKFKKTWNKISKENIKLKRTTIILSTLIFITGLIFRQFTFLLIPLSIIFITTIYVILFAKAVEKGTMVHMYPISKVTEGDWIDKNISYKGKYICGPKDLGISKKQILMLKKYKIKKVPVKVGIPFIPSFLAGFIATILIGNLISVLINSII
jgi:Flp pilus assembly protein protease CpaA